MAPELKRHRKINVRSFRMASQPPRDRARAEAIRNLNELLIQRNYLRLRLFINKIMSHPFPGLEFEFVLFFNKELVVKNSVGLEVSKDF